MSFKRFRQLIITIINLSTVLYGITLIYGNHYIRILEPPERYILIACALILPVVSQLFLHFKQQRYLGWSLVLSSMLWAFIAWFYFVHPVPNGGWTLAVGYVLLTFSQLYGGDFKRNET